MQRLLTSVATAVYLFLASVPAHAEEAPAKTWEVDLAAGAGGPVNLTPPVFVADDRSHLACNISVETGGDERYRVIVLDGRTGARVMEILPEAGGQVRMEAMSPDGRYAVLHRQGRDFATLPLEIIELPSGEVRSRVEGAHSPTWIPGGFLLALSSATEPRLAYRLVEPATGEVKQTLIVDEGHQPEAWTGDGERLATLGSGTSVAVFEVATGKQLWKTRVDANEELRGLAFVDRDTLRGVSDLGRVTTWNVATGQVVARVEPQADIVRPSGLSADGRYVLVGESERWDAETFTVRERLVLPLRALAAERTMPLVLRPAEHWAIVGWEHLPKLAMLHLREMAWRPLAAPDARDAAPKRQPPPAAVEATDDQLRDPAWWLAEARREWPAAEPAEVRALQRLRIAQGAARLGQADLALAELANAKLDEALPGLQRTEFPSIVAPILAVVAQHLSAGGDDDAGTRLIHRFELPEKEGAVVRAGVIRGQLQHGDLAAAMRTAASSPAAREAAAEPLVGALLAADREAEAIEIVNVFPRQRTRLLARVAEARAAAGELDAASMPGEPAENLDGDFWARCVAAAADAGHVDAAVRLAASITDEHKRAQAHVALARSLLARGKVAEAEAAAKAIRRHPLYRQAAQTIVLHHAQRGDFAGAAALIDDPSQLKEFFAALQEAGDADAAQKLHQQLRSGPMGRWLEPTPPGQVVALADADELDRALALWTPEQPAKATPERSAVAAAAFRASRLDLYERLRAPLAAGIDDQSGALTRAEAVLPLLYFDLATGNVEGAMASLALLPPTVQRGLALGAFDIVRSLERRKAAAELRATLYVLAQPDIPIVKDRDRLVGLSAYWAAAIGAHDDPAELRAWHEWTASLREPAMRVTARLVIADALHARLSRDKP